MLFNSNDLQTVKKGDRKINPVYKHLVEKVRDTADELRSEWDSDGEIRKTLSDRNKGIRCYMKKTDLFVSDEKQTDAFLKFSREHETKVIISKKTCVETLLAYEDNDTMGALYAPFCSPCSTVYSGTPCELTDLACRSTLLWQLKSPPLRLSNSDEGDFCKLYATTSFYIPNVEVRRSSFLNNWKDYENSKNCHLTVMSSVESVLCHWGKEKREDIKMSNIIYLKLMTPFRMALRQNINREKLDPPQPPIRRIVIGNMDIRHNERGVNSLFCQTLHRVIEQYKGCFDEVIVCSNSTSTDMYLSVYTKLDECKI